MLFDCNLIPLPLYERLFKSGFRGIHMGGCVHGNRRFRRRAHAHCHDRDPHKGWICILSQKSERIVNSNGNLTRLALHEMAHILAPNDYHHGKKYCEALVSIGGRKAYGRDYAFIEKNLSKIRRKIKLQNIA